VFPSTESSLSPAALNFLLLVHSSTLLL